MNPFHGNPADIEVVLEAALKDVVGPILGRSIAGWARARLGPKPGALTVAQIRTILEQSIYLTPAQVDEVVRKLSPARSPAAAEPSRREVPITGERDVVVARSEAKQIATDMGFELTDAVKIATVVSELARNIVLYAGTGRLELETFVTPRPGIGILAIDNGPGIPNVDDVLSGRYRSKSGMGLGLLGSKRLVDELRVDSAPGKGTRVVARKYLDTKR